MRSSIVLVSESAYRESFVYSRVVLIGSHHIQYAHRNGNQQMCDNLGCYNARKGLLLEAESFTSSRSGRLEGRRSEIDCNPLSQFDLVDRAPFPGGTRCGPGTGWCLEDAGKGHLCAF